MFAFGRDITLGTFIYTSESSDPYKYVVMTSINYKDRHFCVARDIRYQKVILFITREYVSLKSMSEGAMCKRNSAAGGEVGGGK
jgi:hypothetical protein